MPTAQAKGARRWGVTAGLVVAWAGAVALAPDPGAAGADGSPRVAVDSLTPLGDLVSAAAACEQGCERIVYAWTPRMPLSRRGIANVERAAENLGVPVTIVAHEELQAHAERETPGESVLIDGLLDAGMLAHAPALVVLRGDEVVGTAILGYKSQDAYASLVTARLAGRDAGYPESPTPYARIAERVEPRQAPADYQAVGLPGAYFRWVPNTRLIAYESDDRIYLLDLGDGQSRVAPGFVDFVPTPDGRYFVTPGRSDEGLQFFDAHEVLEGAARGRGYEVLPIFNDLRMRDQYPSVGILERDGARTRYRILTSWFQGLLYRDYDIVVNEETGASSVRPIGEPVVPCRGARLSTPIMSQDGREVAVRDESTGTTKIFAFVDDGTCREVADLGAVTTKVAWHASGQKLAFATPRRAAGAEQGIFVYDRQAGATVRVPASEGASQLAFPDFIGDESVVFMIPQSPQQRTSFFRVVDGID